MLFLVSRYTRSLLRDGGPSSSFFSKRVQNIQLDGSWGPPYPIDVKELLLNIRELPFSHVWRVIVVL